MFEQPITRNNNYYLIKGIYSVLPYPENYAPSPPKTNYTFTYRRGLPIRGI